ncbi:hypothetical protein Tco_0921375 [Tanacetum coccineum]
MDPSMQAQPIPTTPLLNTRPSDARHNPSQLLRLLLKEVCFISHGDLHVSIGFLIPISLILKRCYLLNDYDDVGKLKAKGYIGVFVGYSKGSAAFRIMKSSTTNITTSNEEISQSEEEVFHKVSESFPEESSSSSLNDDVQQSSVEVVTPSTKYSVGNK